MRERRLLSLAEQASRAAAWLPAPTGHGCAANLGFASCEPCASVIFLFGNKACKSRSQREKFESNARVDVMRASVFFLQVVAWGECLADCASGGIAVGGTTVAIPLVVALNILTSIDLLTDGEGSLHGVP